MSSEKDTNRAGLPPSSSSDLLGVLDYGSRSIARSRCSGLQSCQMPLAPSRRLAPFAALCRLLARIFHALRPPDNSRPIPHLSNRLGRDDVQIMHLVARRAKNDQIVRGVVLPVAVEVANLQNLSDAKTAMCAVNAIAIMPKGKLPIVDGSGGHLLGAFVVPSFADAWDHYLLMLACLFGMWVCMWPHRLGRIRP